MHALSSKAKQSKAKQKPKQWALLKNNKPSYIHHPSYAQITPTFWQVGNFGQMLITLIPPILGIFSIVYLNIIRNRLLKQSCYHWNQAKFDLNIYKLCQNTWDLSIWVFLTLYYLILTLPSHHHIYIYIYVFLFLFLFFIIN